MSGILYTDSSGQKHKQSPITHPLNPPRGGGNTSQKLAFLNGDVPLTLAVAPCSSISARGLSTASAGNRRMSPGNSGLGRSRFSSSRASRVRPNRVAISHALSPSCTSIGLVLMAGVSLGERGMREEGVEGEEDEAMSDADATEDEWVRMWVGEAEDVEGLAADADVLMSSLPDGDGSAGRVELPWLPVSALLAEGTERGLFWLAASDLAGASFNPNVRFDGNFFASRNETTEGGGGGMLSTSPDLIMWDDKLLNAANCWQSTPNRRDSCHNVSPSSTTTSRWSEDGDRVEERRLAFVVSEWAEISVLTMAINWPRGSREFQSYSCHIAALQTDAGTLFYFGVQGEALKNLHRAS